jgi:tRNA-modifying protein YgfZ
MAKNCMNKETLDAYSYIRDGGAGVHQSPRGLIAVWGNEAVQFLDGLITNNVKALADGEQMLAAFPNAQGRLLAVVRMQRQDDRYLFETEEATHEKVFQNLFRFTFAGDFFVEDLSEGHKYLEIVGPSSDVYHPSVSDRWPGAIAYKLPHGAAYFVMNASADPFRSFLVDENACVPITDDLYEVLRVESGTPRYGVDMDETTIVPELGVDGMISYTKGCYIGQEIIARIHFRGHVAKQLTGLILSGVDEPKNMELTSVDGKNAGRVTSVAYSRRFERDIALGYVRYEHLADGTELKIGEKSVSVKNLPFV